MAFIPEETLREIRERTSLVELIGEHVPLRKAGQAWKGLCPFHAEKTPSFTVSDSRGVFHCFGCGAGGTAFDFLMRREGMTFPEAAHALARRAGVAVPSDDLSPEARRAEAERAALLAVNAAAAAWFRARLAAPEGRAARDYLAARGVTEPTAEAFGLGYAPAGWENLVRHLAAQGHRPELVARAGLAAARERAAGHYDRFRDRLMIPIADPQGRVVAFGGRAMAKDEAAKYLNSAESPVYRKSEVLFGLPQAKEAIRRADLAILVEGYFDCIALHQAGVREAVATCGTALTRDHVQALTRYTRNVVTLFDGDEAGLRAAERGLELFLEAEVSAHVVELPAGEDPDTFVRRAGADALRAMIDRAPSLFEAYVDARARREDVATIEGKHRLLRSIERVIDKARDRFTRDMLIKRTHDRLALPDVEERLLRRHIRAGSALRPAAGGGPAVARSAARRPAPEPVETARQSDGDCLLRAVLLSPPFAAELLGGDVVDLLGDRAVAALVGAAVGLLRREGPGAVRVDRLADAVRDDEARRRLARVAVALDQGALDEAAARRMGEDAVRSIRVRAIDRRIAECGRDMEAARRHGDHARLSALEGRLAALLGELKQLSR
jgi:DNA primase